MGEENTLQMLNFKEIVDDGLKYVSSLPHFKINTSFFFKLMILHFHIFTTSTGDLNLKWTQTQNNVHFIVFITAIAS